MRSNKLHVPSFIIMSFFFTHNILISSDFHRIYKRFERLLIPYIGWPIILFCIYNLILLSGKKYYTFSFKKLIHQIILGNAWTIPFHFWFLFDLILTSIIFLLILKTMKNHYLFIFLILLMFSYFLQYSELNYKLFIILGEPSLAKENEFIPYAVTGFILFESNIMNKLYEKKIKTFIISLIFLKLTEYYKVFSSIEGFAFQGIKSNIRSVCLIFIFSLFSSKEKENKYTKIFKTITSFTGGIYYIHRIIQWNFINIFKDIKKGTFFGIILIYIISYMICFIGTIIFGKTRLKYLFS